MEGEINLFNNFNLWTKIHYYAFKLRRTYPNLFFYFFSRDGVVVEKFSTKEVYDFMRIMRVYRKEINGLWGVASLIFENKNGQTFFKMMNNTSFFNSSTSLGCVQDGDLTKIKEFKVKNRNLKFGGKII
jgi:hypothetical protein